jgi:hypothetical protein
MMTTLVATVDGTDQLALMQRRRLLGPAEN